MPHFLLFVQYGEHLLYAKYEFEKERSTNPAFGVFLETVKRLESHKIEINEYLLLPTSRLARYPLLLEVVLKYTPEDHVDRVAIPNVVRTIGELLERVNRAGDKLKLLQLDKGLTSRQGEGVVSPIFPQDTPCQNPINDLSYFCFIFVGLQTGGRETFGSLQGSIGTARADGT